MMTSWSTLTVALAACRAAKAGRAGGRAGAGVGCVDVWVLMGFRAALGLTDQCGGVRGNRESCRNWARARRNDGLQIQQHVQSWPQGQRQRLGSACGQGFKQGQGVGTGVLRQCLRSG
jgi:hypothetical protein